MLTLLGDMDPSTGLHGGWVTATPERGLNQRGALPHRIQAAWGLQCGLGALDGEQPVFPSIRRGDGWLRPNAVSTRFRALVGKVNAESGGGRAAAAAGDPVARRPTFAGDRCAGRGRGSARRRGPHRPR